MKFKMNCLNSVLVAICVILSACNNSYEKQIVGFYRVDKYEKSDNAAKGDLPTLLLNNDKTFVLTFTNKKINGKWDADNYGDWIAVDFYYGNQHSQGQLGGQNLEILEIVSPRNFGIDAKLYSFTRVQNH